MKKCVLFVTLFFITGAAALYGKRINNLIYEKPQTKTVQYSVYAAKGYSSSIYRKSKVRVVLSIYKFSPNTVEMVWEGIIDEARLKSYPSSSNPAFREVSVHNVLDSKETLAAYYKVIYVSEGSELSYEKGVSLGKGAKAEAVAIEL